MIEFELAIRHHGCPVSDTSNQFPDVHIQNISKTEIEGEKCKRILCFSSPKSEVENFASQFRDRAKVELFERISEFGEDDRIYYHANIDYNEDHSIAGIVGDHGCYQHTTVTVQQGIEHWGIYSENKEKVRELISDIQSKGNELVSYRAVNVDKVSGGKFGGYESLYNQFTTAQRRSFRTALRMGYYESNQNVTIEDIADQLDRHRTTVWEQLTEVENKVLKSVGIVMFGAER